MLAIQLDCLTVEHFRGARNVTPACGEDVLAVAGRMDEKIRQRLHGQSRARPVDARHAGKVPVQAAHGMANRPLGAELVLSGVGPNRLTVGDPEVEVAGYAALGLRGGDARLAGMAHQEIHHDEVVAARRGGVLLDPHAQCVEAQFGIAHEGEQLGDGRDARFERDHLRPWPPAFARGGHERSAIPGARLRHRAGL